MKIYNSTTRELFGFINFEASNLFSSYKKKIKIVCVKYCYVFPQKVFVWDSGIISETWYYFLFWRIIISNKDHSYTTVSVGKKLKETDDE